jgi:hypothetical protein
MQVETLTFANGDWSAAFPSLDSTSTLVVVFGAPELPDLKRALGELRAAFPNARLVGCSSAGEIAGAKVLDASLSVAIARFDRTTLEVAVTQVDGPDDSHSAGVRLAKALERPDLRGVVLLSDGLAVNGSALVAGVNATVAPDVVVTGGLAGDGSRFQKTWVLDGAEPKRGVVSAVGLYGDRVAIGHGSKGGWDKFGPERKVTRSKANVLFELDGEPALKLYKSYLGDRAEGLPATGLLFPLALRASAGEAKTLVRTILAIDEAEQSLTFAGDVPEGQLVQLMRANFDRLVEAAGDAARRASQPIGGAPRDTLAIAISCIGRRLVLGERIEEELEAALDDLPADTRQIGFYSYGEICPYEAGASDLHNQTMTLTTIAER